MATIVDSHSRSLLKGLSWRVTATATTVLITLMVTGNVGTALTVGGIEAVGKIFLYYAHERVWFRIPGDASSNRMKNRARRPYRLNSQLQALLSTSCRRHAQIAFKNSRKML